VGNIKTIHIFGASGSGSTTFARALEKAHGYHFIDTDDAIWKDTDPPFRQRKTEKESLEYLEKELCCHVYNVISGAFVGWGDPVKDKIDLFVYMVLPLEIRLERIQKREENRFGDRVLPGGDLYLQHLDFLDWVSQYETLDIHTRSMAQHEKWLQSVKKTVLKVTEPMTIEELLEWIEPFIR